MIPYILALAGGYLIGSSAKEKFADGGGVSDTFYNKVVKIMNSPISIQEQLFSVLMMVEDSLNESSWLYIDDVNEYFNVKKFEDCKKGVDYALSEAKAEMGDDFDKDRVVDILDDFSSDLGMYIKESEDFKSKIDKDLNKLEREIKETWPSMTAAYMKQIEKVKN